MFWLFLYFIISEHEGQLMETHLKLKKRKNVNPFMLLKFSFVDSEKIQRTAILHLP